MSSAVTWELVITVAPSSAYWRTALRSSTLAMESIRWRARRGSVVVAEGGWL